MKLGIKRKECALFLTGIIISIGFVIGNFSIPAYAKTSSENPVGRYYEIGENDNYDYGSANSSSTGDNTFGKFTATGDFSKIDGTTYQIGSGNVDFKYIFDVDKFSESETEWHLVEDKSKKVNEIKLSRNILKGALIVESSIDGKNWTTDFTKQNIFATENDLSAAFYTTNDIQQQNGCYFRVTVAYKLERKKGERKVVVFNVDDKEIKNIVEVYEFKVINKETADSTETVKNERKELGKKVNAGKDTGYSENNTIGKDDPHFGWDLGTFFVDGYTRATNDSSGTPVFLKNVGDKVTLWFNLKQDINSLNGNSNITISEDKNGWDKDFEVAQSNFGHGTLIIRYTDWNNKPQTPIVYTNYLKANAKTGSDTRVQLFEEGDYEVSLDYEIKNSPRQVGSVSVVPQYTNYKITFKFKIRNGNSMVYPFDIKTNAELSDKATTQNGFKLDMAKSRYLTIDVSKSIVNVGSDGKLTIDERFNRPASDGEEYTDEGIYTFTVKNLFTNSAPTTKTIYVGSDKNILALAKTNKSILEINEMIGNGAKITDDGTVTTDNVNGKGVDSKTKDDVKEKDDTNETNNKTDEESLAEDNGETKGKAKETKNNSLPIIPIVVIGVVGIGVIYGLTKRK